jgi:hypothetical protein
VQSDPPQLPFLWTVGIAARETLKYLDRRGIDAAHCCQRQNYPALSSR